jgi:hypothetical protein
MSPYLANANYHHNYTQQPSILPLKKMSAFFSTPLLWLFSADTWFTFTVDD